MAHRVHLKYHIKLTASLHPLHSLCAHSYTVTPRSFLRRCWSTNSHGFGGVDRSQWKLQTNTGAAVSDVSKNNLKDLIHTSHLCVCDCACVGKFIKKSGKKWEQLCVYLCVCACACVYESEDLKAVQRHYSIKFMKAFTVTLAIK